MNVDIIKIISNELLVFFCQHTTGNSTAIAPIFLDNNSIRLAIIQFAANCLQKIENADAENDSGRHCHFEICEFKPLQAFQNHTRDSKLDYSHSIVPGGLEVMS